MLDIQAVTREDTLRVDEEKPFNMIDNYIYLYHTKTLIAFKTFSHISTG